MNTETQPNTRAVNDQPGASSAASLIFRPASYVEPLNLTTLFERTRPLEVELGSGDGSFLVQYASAHPEHNFLGVERLLGRLRKVDRKGLRAHLSNLRLLRLEASYVAEYLLPRASVRALHIYFPDPWPKRRHHVRRLVNDRFVEIACLILAPGGYLHLRTDDADYFANMTAACLANRGFQPVPIPEELGLFVTDFEKSFLAKGVSIYRAAYQFSNQAIKLLSP